MKKYQGKHRIQSPFGKAKEEQKNFFLLQQAIQVRVNQRAFYSAQGAQIRRRAAEE